MELLEIVAKYIADLEEGLEKFSGVEQRPIPKRIRILLAKIESEKS